LIKSDTRAKQVDINDRAPTGGRSLGLLVARIRASKADVMPAYMTAAWGLSHFMKPLARLKHSMLRFRIGEGLSEGD
jgi:hypothetical protein